jgi:DNA repair protein RadC
MMKLAPHDRPREKLERSGLGALGDHELLALVLGHGRPGRAALAVAAEVLAAAGGVHGLTRISREELSAVPGIGVAMASRIQAAVEIGRRTLIVAPPARPRLVNAEEAAAYLVPQFGAYPVERFGVLLLDTKHRLMKVQLVAVGSLDTTVVHPREVFRPATIAGAAAVVLFHNHPSGDPTPSPEDVRLTRRLMTAGTIIGIDVVDHLVLGDTSYCSIRESKRF